MENWITVSLTSSSGVMTWCIKQSFSSRSWSLPHCTCAPVANITQLRLC